MYKLSLVSVTLVLYCATLISCQVKYAVTGPKMLRPGTPYLLSVTTTREKSTVIFYFTARITSTADNQDLIKMIYKLKTGDTNMLTLNIPQNVPQGSYMFYAEAFNGVTFNQSHSVSVSRKVHSLVIQTDKKLYKPGQKCHFRVIAFKSDLKSFKEEVNVTIYDTASNKIKKLVNQKSIYGVISGELELSNVTPLGQWKITAETKYAKENTYFQVAEYVLPKFEVLVDTPSHFFVNKNNPTLQENLQFSIIAKYTYGKPLKGIARVAIKLNRHYWYYKEPQPVITKLLELKDGKADVSLSTSDLKRLMPSTWRSSDISYQTFFIDANVTETITGLILGANKTFVCRPYRLQLSFLPGSPSNYKPGLPYKAFLGLKNVDGTPVELSDLQDSNGNFRFLSIEVSNSYPYISYPYHFYKRGSPLYPFPPRPPTPIITKILAKLDQNGHAMIEIKTLPNTETLNIKATYLDQVSNTSLLSNRYVSQFKTRDNGGIQLSIKNSPHVIKPRNVVYFNAKTVHSVDTIFFQIMAKGLVTLSRTIKSSKVRTSHDFGMMFTDSLTLRSAPQVRFVVYYITAQGELIADSISLGVEDYFVNKISLSFSKNQTDPGDESVTLDVDTTRNSFVGLLGVDQSVLLLHAGNDITQDGVSNELTEYTKMYYGHYKPMARFKRSSMRWPIFSSGSDTSTLLSNAGLFVLTNLYIKRPEYLYRPTYNRKFGRGGANGPQGNPGIAGAPAPEGAPAPAPPRDEDDRVTNSGNAVSVRKDFPETFIWTDVMSNSRGKVELKVKVPDTITSWVATGFSVNSNLGLGVSEAPAKLTVIKPFFISLSLPYSIIRGEQFALQVTVFNYYGQDLETDIKLLASEYFQVIKCDTKMPVNGDAVRRVKVGNNDAKAVYFWVVATSLGQIPIEVTARAGVAADAMRVKLLVKPEGQAQSYSASDFIQVEGEEMYDKKFEVKFPESGVVLGSIHLEMTLIGDVIGSSLNGIEDLLKMPYGCGEQNLLSFAPDVFILHYLTVSFQLTVTIEIKALKYINSGYQRQLTYQRKDGSYSAFGERDSSGSTWLSAFTIKCFHQAKDFIPVEDDKIARTLDWIINNQAENGSFHEPPGGRVIHTNMQGGSSSDAAMTAYVLISLLENKENTNVDVSKMQDSITKATSLLESSLSEYSSNSYILAIISYALHKANSPQLPAVLTLLDNLAIYEGGLKYWDSKPETPSSKWKSPYGRPKSYNIELASYVLMVYSQQNDLSKSLPIAKWLLSQRNANGGFASTQDTVLALEALSWFASLVAPQAGGRGILVKLSDASGTTLHTFDRITRANSLFLQSYELPESTTAVSVEASGDGVALVQLIVNYNMDVEDKSQFLNLKINTKPFRDEMALSVSTSWMGEEVSGMVLLEVNILTGFSLNDQNDLKLQIGDSFKKLEKSHNKIVIYLDELTEREISFTLKLKEILAVSNVKPALVKVYRYYDTDSVASGFYSSQSGQTWEGACPLCCPAK